MKIDIVWRAVLSVGLGIGLVFVAPLPAHAQNWTSNCKTISYDRDRCGYEVNGQVAAQAYYHDNVGERRMCAWDTLGDGHSAAVRYRRYGSTGAYSIKWNPNGKDSVACTAGRPGADGTRWTMEACIGEYGSRTLLSCDDLVVVTV